MAKFKGLKERITYHIYNEVPIKELPKTVRVYERDWNGFTGRIGIYRRKGFRKSDYRDCYDIVYKLVEVK